jgi:hypothetical protein
MDSLRLCLGLAPVALYLWLLGVRSLSRRPRLVTGVRDSAALALAVSGLVVVGPIELFFPHEAAVWFGPYVWMLVLALYAMCAVLWLLVSRPRLVIYNISLDKLRPTLADVVESLDAEARWAGDSLALPKVGVQLYAEGFAVLRGVSLIAAGGKQSQAGWRRLHDALCAALAREEVARNPLGLGLFLVGLFCLAAIGWSIARNPLAVGNALWDIAQSLRQMVGL